VTVAVDTNVLAYAEGVNGEAGKAAALQILRTLPPASTLLPVQVLGELFSVLVRKAGRTREEASAAVLSWGDSFPLIESSGDVMLAATDLARSHQFGIWDAMILSAAADGRCRLLLSEDLQDGFTWCGVTVVNPFRTPGHPFLGALLDRGPDATGRRRRGLSRRRA
jgi:predicted nucleic acid-binding protein